MKKIDFSHLTEQELFDKACEGLASQGFKRAVLNGMCRYQTAAGLRCAAGWLMEKKDLHLLNDCGGWFDVVRNSRATVAHQEFIQDLQKSHDGDDALDSPSPADVRDRLLNLALAFDLTPHSSLVT